MPAERLSNDHACVRGGVQDAPAARGAREGGSWPCPGQQAQATRAQPVARRISKRFSNAARKADSDSRAGARSA
eukprot:15464987-Alexandrium_andersonii.AAC.1